MTDRTFVVSYKDYTERDSHQPYATASEVVKGENAYIVGTEYHIAHLSRHVVDVTEVPDGYVLGGGMCHQ